MDYWKSKPDIAEQFKLLAEFVFEKTVIWK